jgi:hypothetical protein
MLTSGIFLLTLLLLPTSDGYHFKGVRPARLHKALYSNEQSEIFGFGSAPRSEKDASFGLIRSGVKTSLGLLTMLLPSIASKVRLIFFLVE